ncbi:MAG: DMT family transporter [Rhodospirillales bacterium]|nr:DMT family transporter [Rhodospirillales bacterium]
MTNLASSRQQARNAETLGRLLVIGSAVAWSGAGIFTKSVEADVWTVLFWRGALAAVLMWAYLVWRQGGSALTDASRLGLAGWAAAAVGSAATICFIAAFKNTAVANVAIIYATAPFAAAAIALFWMREAPGCTTLVAAAFCVIGVAVMVGGSSGTPNLSGDLLAVGMTVLMALMMVIMRRYPQRPMTLAVGPISSLQLVLVGWLMTDPLAISGYDLLLVCAFGIAHAAATIMLAEGVLRIRAAEAGLLSTLEMPLVPLWGFLFLAEVPGMWTVVGGGIVLVTLVGYLTTAAQIRLRPGPDRDRR